MNPDQGYLYWIICLRIYEIGGPCPDTADVLARRSGMTRKRVEKALESLVDNRHLRRDQDGLMNDFAEQILIDSKKILNQRKTNGKLGGKISAEIRKQNQRNDPSTTQAALKRRSTHKHKHRQEQLLSSDEDNKTRATLARSGSEWPENYLEIFWKAFPPYRREGKKAVAAKLEGIRKRGEVAWQVLIDGVYRYAASEPGEYSCAPMVWLNQGRWDMSPRPPRKDQPKNGYVAVLQNLRQRQQAERQDQGGFSYDENGNGPVIDLEPFADPGRLRH